MTIVSRAVVVHLDATTSIRGLLAIHSYPYLGYLLNTMNSVNRRPLVPVPRALSLQIPTVLSPLKRTASGVSKRARSPDPAAESNPKRVKGGLPSPGTLAARDDDRKEKERKRVERDAQKEEFRIKYTKAFPGWVFYFDLDLLDPDSAPVREYLESKVTQLGGVSPIIDLRYISF